MVTIDVSTFKEHRKYGTWGPLQNTKQWRLFLSWLGDGLSNGYVRNKKEDLRHHWPPSSFKTDHSPDSNSKAFSYFIYSRYQLICWYRDNLPRTRLPQSLCNRPIPMCYSQPLMEKAFLLLPVAEYMGKHVDSAHMREKRTWLSRCCCLDRLANWASNPTRFFFGRLVMKWGTQSWCWPRNSSGNNFRWTGGPSGSVSSIAENHNTHLISLSVGVPSFSIGR